jgi:hypothetical protein
MGRSGNRSRQSPPKTPSAKKHGASVETSHSSHPPTVYRSAIDLWIAVLLLSPPVFAAAVAIFLWNEGNDRGALILMITAAGTLLLTLIFTVPCRYTLEADELDVRCGLLSYRIPLKTIERVEPSRTIASGPALSMKRVVVYTRMKNYVLSPRDRERFLADVRAAAETSRGDQADSVES